MAKKKPRPQIKLPIGPNAPVWKPGDKVVVLRPSLWYSYCGVVEKVDEGMCRVILKTLAGSFDADIPAAQLKADL